jgi:hypothetical protein
MPIEVRMHESGKYMISTFRGAIHDNELIPPYEAFYAARKVPVNTPELTDLSAADLSALTRDGLAAMSQWGEKLMRSRGEIDKKTAIYLPSHLGRSKVVMYEVLAQGSPEIVRTFSKLQPAVDWLLGRTVEPSAGS